MQSRNRIDTLLICAGVLIGATEMIYTWLWVAMDIFGRLGLWPEAWTWFDLAAFLDTVSLANEISFAGFTFLYSTAYILFLLRRSLSLPVLLGAVLMGQIDWVLLAMNTAHAESVAGSIELLGQAALIMIISSLIARRALH